MNTQPGQHTYAGADDDSFDDYAQALRGATGARVVPLLYRGAPDHSGLPGSAPFMGTVGVFDSHGAITVPIGYFPQQYAGDLPLAQQPTVRSPDPWDDPEIS
jgi:hypothetical protein